MKAVTIPDAGEEFEVVERDVPQPAADQVRIEVGACGICHSDAFLKEGDWPGIDYPRVPGHEIAGRVDAVGEDVPEWDEGDRIGVGWHGGHCFVCEPCRRENSLQCENGAITGFSYDGGYAEYVTVPHEAVAQVPDGLDDAVAAPLMCAGVTTYNSLRNSTARPGDRVAIQGIGGLGHLGVQYASTAGFETIAVSHGTEKEELAYDLGADGYIDAANADPSEELTGMGGADVILATAPDSEEMSRISGGLALNGQLITLGVPEEPVELPVEPFVMGDRSMQGWGSGHARDSQDALEFSALRGVEPMGETYPLEEASAAYEDMLSNDVRFRAVLEP